MTVTSAEIDKYGAYYQSNLNFAAGPSENSQQIVTLAVDFEREEFTQRGESLFGDPNQDQSMNNLGLVGEYRASDFGGFSFSLRCALMTITMNSTTSRRTGQRRRTWSHRSTAEFTPVTGPGRKTRLFPSASGFFRISSWATRI